MNLPLCWIIPISMQTCLIFFYLKKTTWHNIVLQLLPHILNSSFQLDSLRGIHTHCIWISPLFPDEIYCQTLNPCFTKLLHHGHQRPQCCYTQWLMFGLKLDLSDFDTVSHSILETVFSWLFRSPSSLSHCLVLLFISLSNSSLSNRNLIQAIYI